MEYELKTWSQYFQAVVEGKKHFEIRNNDRGFHVGDTLILKEYIPFTEGKHPLGRYTGKSITVKVDYILEQFDGIPSNISIMSISALPSVTPPTVEEQCQCGHNKEEHTTELGLGKLTHTCQVYNCDCMGFTVPPDAMMLTDEEIEIHIGKRTTERYLARQCTDIEAEKLCRAQLAKVLSLQNL